MRKTVLAAISLLVVRTLCGQPDVILQGTARSGGKPIIIYSGAVNSDSVRLPSDDEANHFGDRLNHALYLSGAVKMMFSKPDTLLPGMAIPDARLEIRKASKGGALTVSLLAGDAIKPYWFQSYGIADKPVDQALVAASAIQMSLTGNPGFAASRLVYAMKTGTGGLREIVVSDAMGNNARQLTNHQTIIMSPSVTPDGSRIYFTSFKDGNADIWSVPTNGGAPQIFVSTPYIESGAAVSPDGKTVVFGSSSTGYMQLYSIGTDGTGKTQLTFADGISTSPSWSPSGDRIAFCSDRGDSPQVYTMASDGTDVRRITYEGDYNDSPRWSPAGDKIVYVRRENDVFSLYMCDPAGVSHKKIAYISSDMTDPSFVPSGNRISFVTVWQGQPAIALVTPETGDIDLLVGNVDAQRPVWAPPVQ